MMRLLILQLDQAKSSHIYSGEESTWLYCAKRWNNKTALGYPFSPSDTYPCKTSWRSIFVPGLGLVLFLQLITWVVLNPCSLRQTVVVSLVVVLSQCGCWIRIRDPAVFIPKARAQHFWRCSQQVLDARFVELEDKQAMMRGHVP